MILWYLDDDELPIFPKEYLAVIGSGTDAYWPSKINSLHKVYFHFWVVDLGVHHFSVLKVDFELISFQLPHFDWGLAIQRGREKAATIEHRYTCNIFLMRLLNDKGLAGL